MKARYDLLMKSCSVLIACAFLMAALPQPVPSATRMSPNLESGPSSHATDRSRLAYQPAIASRPFLAPARPQGDPLPPPTAYDLLHNTAPSTSWTDFDAGSVNVVLGNFVIQSLDIVIPGRELPFAFLRTYNSANPQDGPLGVGWTHSYNLSVLTETVSTMIVNNADGRQDRFTRQSDGSYTAPAGIYNVLSRGLDGAFTLKLTDQTRYVFSASGALANVIDRNGNTLSLNYTGNDLASMIDTVGRPITFTYDSGHHLTHLTDFSGRVVTYTYSGNGMLASVVDQRGKITLFTYDANQHLTAITDANGHTPIQNIYDSSNRVIQQRDALSNTTTLAYDWIAGQTVVTDARNASTLYFYDATYRLTGGRDDLGYTSAWVYDRQNNKTYLTDKLGYTTQLAYDVTGNMTFITDALGNVSQFTYDSRNNVLSARDALNHRTSFTYDANGNLLTAVDPLSQTTFYAYDTHGQLTRITDANGHSTLPQYDAYGNPTSITDALNKVTSFGHDAIGRVTGLTDARSNTHLLSYDATDNPTQITDPKGKTTTFTYDPVGNRVTGTDTNGRTTFFTYDARNQLISVTDPAGSITRYSYDTNGNQIRVTNANTNTTTYEYDSLDRLVTTRDALGNAASYGYDANGNLITTTDALSRTATVLYDALNRIVRITDSLSNTVQYEYDAVGNRIASTDANGNRTQFVYDARDQLTQVIDSLGGSVVYAYNAVGSRISVTNPNGRATHYTYDELNRLISMSDPLGNATHMTYDDVSNLTSSTDPNGQVTAFVYDSLNRQVQVTYPDQSIQYEFDPVGNRVTMTDTTGVTRYGYDALDRLTSLTSPDNQTASYQYDALGNRTRVTYPTGKSVVYSYDALNRLASVIDNVGIAHYAYDALGNSTAITYPNGVAGTFTYDGANRLTDIQYSSPITSTRLRISYVLDKVGNRVQMADNEGLTTYDYDALYRLTGVHYPDGTQSRYAYDPGGNRTSMVGPEGTTTYTYDAGDRLAASVLNGQTTTYTWDRNGNMLSKGAIQYTYDAANRLTQVLNGANKIKYAYDGDGHRTSKSINDVVTRYLWDTVGQLPQILAETTSGSSTQYTYGNDLLSMTGPSGATSYYQSDGLGSVRQMSDSSANLDTRYSYDAFGSVRSQVGTSPNPFQFAGQQVDDETGLIYMRARYYDPTIGRFISRDPMGDIEGLYQYANNNPINRFDPSGKFSLSGIINTVKSVVSTVVNVVKSVVNAVIKTVNNAVSTVRSVVQTVTRAVTQVKQQPTSASRSAPTPTIVPTPTPNRGSSTSTSSSSSNASSPSINAPTPTPVPPPNYDPIELQRQYWQVMVNIEQGARNLAKLDEILVRPPDFDDNVANIIETAPISCAAYSTLCVAIIPAAAAASTYIGIGALVIGVVSAGLDIGFSIGDYLTSRNPAVKLDASHSYEQPAPDLNLGISLPSPLANNQASNTTQGQGSVYMSALPTSGIAVTKVSFNAPSSVSGGKASMNLSIPGPATDLGYSPNTPLPTSPADWYVSPNSITPQLCAQHNGSPDGAAITSYRFVIYNSTRNWDSGFISANCVTPPALGPYTFQWRVKVKDDRGLESYWSTTWHFSINSPAMTVAPIEFSPASPSGANEVRLYTCVDGYSGIGLSLGLDVNTAADGTEGGAWYYIPSQGTYCYNHSDPTTWPRWDTLPLEDGDHVVRATAMHGSERTVIKSTYHLNRRSPSEPQLIAPVQDAWMNSRDVSLQWSPVLRATSYHILVSENPDPSVNPIVDQAINNASVNNAPVSLSADYTSLYWRLMASNEISQSQSTGHFGIDRQPPTVTVTTLPVTQSQTVFVVAWSGVDNASGIKNYDVQYRDGAGGDWRYWQSSTSATSASFIGERGHTYYFKVRGTDNASNQSTFAAGEGDTSTTVDPSASSPPPGPPNPFGDGIDADLTITGTQYADDIRTALSANANAGQTAIPVVSTDGFAPSQEVLVIQMQGTNAGVYEFGNIDGVGPSSITLTQNLTYTYLQTNNSHAQVLRVHHYSNVIVQSGAILAAHPWNGSVGGILVFRAKGRVIVDSGGFVSVYGAGFRAPYYNLNDSTGIQGEGINGVGNQSRLANDNGGGGGESPGYGNAAGGGGGGHASDGTQGGNGQYTGGEGGHSIGTADLSTMLMGGAGGSGGDKTDPYHYGGAGGSGGGIIAIFADQLLVGGTIIANGLFGFDGVCNTGGGGGGAGGSILIVSRLATLGYGVVTALGAIGGRDGCEGGIGGNGSAGRIRIEYATATGTTNPSASFYQYTVPTVTLPIPLSRYGSGADGNLNVFSTQYADEVRTGFSASSFAGQPAILVASATGFATGQEVLVIQMQGSTAGAYEYGIVAGTGPGVITLTQNLVNSYFQGGNARAQVLRVMHYHNITVQSGATLNVHTWDGFTGGVMVFRSDGQVIVQSGGTISTRSAGFRGPSLNTNDGTGLQGEGTNGQGLQSRFAYGNAGGGGESPGYGNAAGGGGGGYAGNGASGGNGQYNGGEGGHAVGYADLSLMLMGGAGGSGGDKDDPLHFGGGGGNGGGIISIFANQLLIGGTLNADGAGGGGGGCNTGGGGGGAGGSIRLVSSQAVLGFGTVTSLGGLGGQTQCQGGNGGDGSVGRISIEYMGLSGATNPVANLIQYATPPLPPAKYPTGRYGDGMNGDMVVTNNLFVDTTRAALGSDIPAAQVALTVTDATGFGPGQEVMIIQMQGSTVGTFEYALIDSVTANTLILVNPLQNTYFQSGNGRAQVLRVFRYHNLTVASGASMLAHPWDGSTGGVLVFRANGSVDVQNGGWINMSGYGYRGPGTNYNDGTGIQGEGINGAGGQSRFANGNGGGGGESPGYGNDAGGGGGAYATDGGNGKNGQFHGGQGGLSAGVSDLSYLLMGGAGGSGGDKPDPGHYAGGGGNGAGIVAIYAANIQVEGGIVAGGYSGGTGVCNTGGGGGGAGGSILLVASQANLGNNLVSASGGAGGTAQCDNAMGGNGSPGRIRVEYNTLTGTTDPYPSLNQLPPLMANFASSVYSVSEAAGIAYITITLNTQPDIAATIDYTSADGTAIAGSDYLPISGTLTFAPGETSKAISITIINDSIYRDNRTLALNLSNPHNVTLDSIVSSTLTIIDDDPAPIFRFSTNANSIGEDAGFAVVTVTLYPAPDLTATVDFSATDGTAIAGIDYLPISGTLTFTPGDAYKTFTFTLINDLINELDETVNLTLSHPQHAVLGPTPNAVLTLVNVNPVLTVQFSDNTYSVEDIASTAIVTVTLNSAPGLQVTINYTTADGTAVSGVDYVPVHGALSFAPGHLSQNFSIPILNHPQNQQDRTVSLALSNPTHAMNGNPSRAALNIRHTGLQVQSIHFSGGWNFFSLVVEPPDPRVEVVLLPIAGDYCRVFAETGIFSCDLPGVFRTLTELHAGHGYYIYITNSNGVTVTIPGIVLGSTTPLPLHQGWNWIAYLPQSSIPITLALQSIDGLYQRVIDGTGRAYIPSIPPQFNTLLQMDPGQGYMIYMTTATTLTYPSPAPMALARKPAPLAAPASAGCPEIRPTPYFALVYGSIQVNSGPAPAGTRVEAITPSGDVVGCTVTTQKGAFGLVPIFGADDPGVPGYLDGQAITLRVNGKTAISTPLRWNNDKASHWVDVKLATSLYYLPMVIR